MKQLSPKKPDFFSVYFRNIEKKTKHFALNLKQNKNKGKYSNNMEELHSTVLHRDTSMYEV